MKACWILCVVTTLSATAAWAESPLKSLQFEQQKQLVLKAVKEKCAPKTALSDTDFANKNEVKSFGLLNSKLGYKQRFNKVDVDVFLAGNNLTNQINYTFLFYGNSINDSDKDNQYLDPTVFTDVNPGPNKAYFFTGFNVKYNF